MSITTLTSREFNQHVSGAKLAAKHGPVFITDRGRPAHVLLSIEDYRKMAVVTRNVADFALIGVSVLNPWLLEDS